MSKRVFIAVLGAFLISSAAYEDTKAKCKQVAAPMGSTASAFSQMYGVMKDLDYRAFAAQFSGEEREKLLALAEVNDRVLPIFEEYLEIMEEAALLLQRCSR